MVWHHLVEWDPEEILETRERQKIALARYAKQSLLQWDDIETREIRRWVTRLRDLLQEESPTAGATED